MLLNSIFVDVAAQYFLIKILLTKSRSSLSLRHISASTRVTITKLTNDNFKFFLIHFRSPTRRQSYFHIQQWPIVHTEIKKPLQISIISFQGTYSYFTNTWLYISMPGSVLTARGAICIIKLINCIKHKSNPKYYTLKKASTPNNFHLYRCSEKNGVAMQIRTRFRSGWWLCRLQRRRKLKNSPINIKTRFAAKHFPCFEFLKYFKFKSLCTRVK